MYLFQYGRTLIKLGIVQQFTMEQSSQSKIESAQKELQLQLQLQSSLSTYLTHLLDVKSYTNILVYFQFLALSMIIIITWVE